jgi:magnesium-transporting ATPase (P-type)
MQFYNVMFTALPCIVFVIFDKDVDDSVSMEHPELYRLGVDNEIFTSRAMISWMVTAAFTIQPLYSFSDNIYSHTEVMRLIAALTAISINLAL